MNIHARFITVLFCMFFIAKSYMLADIPTAYTETRSIKPFVYQNYLEPHKTLTMKILSNFKFKGNEKILEVFCGDARFTEEIAQNIPDGVIIGIETSDILIQQANDKYLHMPNVYFKNSHCEAFEFSQKFDLIVSFNSLNYLSNHRPMLRKMRKHLAKGGKVLLSLFSLHRSAQIVDSLESVLSRKEWAEFTKRYESIRAVPELSLEEYRESLEELGFKVLLCERVRYQTVFKSEQALIDWLSTWVPNHVAIPEDRLLAFCTAVTEEFLNRTSQKSSEQIIFIHMPWEIEAVAK